MTPKFITLASVSSLALLAPAHALTIDSFTQAEVTYTDSGLKPDSASSNFKSLDSYAFGGAFTFGAMLNLHHELSLTTGFTQWDADPVVTPGFVSVEFEAEQIPVLLNYRYRLPLDSKGRFTVFAGPTAGFIHQKITVTDRQLGGLPPALVGSDSDSDWKFVYGGTVGINAKLGANWTTGASAQVLMVKASDFTSFGGAGPFIHFERTTRPSFALSLGYNW